jgi:hypothetical protein
MILKRHARIFSLAACFMINLQVNDAEKRAIKEYKKTHPDIDESDLKV